MSMLSDIRPLIDGGKGHNYALPDCVKFIFERIGAHENANFWDIALVTGDTVAPVYSRRHTRREYCVSGYIAESDYPEYVKGVFDALGYACEYVSAAEVAADAARYVEKIAAYIDRGTPVLVKTDIDDVPGWNSDVGTHCLAVGYDGATLKLLVGGTDIVDYMLDENAKLALVFIGEKLRDVTLCDIYKTAILRMTRWLTLPEHDGMYFGAQALRAWADDIEAGRYEREEGDLWFSYGVYVCNIATSGGELTYIFKKLADINPAYGALEEIGREIQALLPAESPAGGRCVLWIRLEELCAGMDMHAVKATMRDKEKRARVAHLLRDYAQRYDRALALIEKAANIITSNF